MGKIITFILGAALALWIGWIMIATDESVRVERAGAACGGTAKVIGAIVRTFDESTGEEFYSLHTTWSEACQSSVWYFFAGAEERRVPGKHGVADQKRPAGSAPTKPEPTRPGKPVGDEVL